jgi:hypothetical protein
MVKIVTGPVMAVKVLVAEMMEAMVEGMTAGKIVAAKTVTEARTETVPAESLGHGVIPRQHDREQNRGSQGNGFSQAHRFLTAETALSAFAAENSSGRPGKRAG